MSTLSWTEIRQNAIQFARVWKDGGDERADAQTFWNEFFEVFGIRRRTVASFEAPVKNLRQTYGRIDLFWKGTLLAEHKSGSQTLDKAQSQAFQYIQDLKNEGREDEIPRYVILSNFRRMVLFDIEPEDAQTELPLWRYTDSMRMLEFELRELHKHIRNFGFFIGQRTQIFGREDPANIKAAELMARLHDEVAESRYPTQAVERLLVRLLFCLFAEDTAIFEPNQFRSFIENRTRQDGSDLGQQLNALFELLNTDTTNRPSNLDEDLLQFPYINGQLFSERLPLAGFTRAMRTQLIQSCNFDWSRISPAIFGSLFQGIMEPLERRRIGAHYTSERDILKLIKPLFLDALNAELNNILADTRTGHRTARLHEFWKKISSLKFLDPACGCGNFLVVAYRELREIETKLILSLYGKGKSGQIEEMRFAPEFKLSQVDVDQFYGIEICDWPARIAETALWLTDHQMNQKLSVETGNAFRRIPLEKSPTIKCANALRINWDEVIASSTCSFVLGNPPFIGAKFQDADQKTDVERVARHIKGRGLLDYVTMWYLKAMEYMQDQRIKCAFVSTNSITQGEQVGILWEEMFRRGAKIMFAHRSFAWQSEARGKAHVHVVIIGFGRGNGSPKRIYEYDDIEGEPSVVEVKNVAPYLVEGDDIVITNRSSSISGAPEIGIGNKPIDNGAYLFTDEEKAKFLAIEPGARKFFRPWIGSIEFIHGYNRWCLWLGDADPAEFKNLPECRKRIEHVKEFRLKSKSLPTQKLAATPRRFHVENFPTKKFLVIPEVSSERRPYIPIAFMSPSTVCSNLVKIIRDARLYHFGVLTSAMHMAWVRQVCGRLESRYRYSAKLVYNNYPWPEAPSRELKKKVEIASQQVIDVRQEYLSGLSTLADLYDPITMPDDLLKAHRSLDRAVDRCYRPEKFTSDRQRMEFLFGLYERLTAPLAPGETAPKRRKTRA